MGCFFFFQGETKVFLPVYAAFYIVYLFCALLFVTSRTSLLQSRRRSVTIKSPADYQSCERALYQTLNQKKFLDNVIIHTNTSVREKKKMPSRSRGSNGKHNACTTQTPSSNKRGVEILRSLSLHLHQLNRYCTVFTRGLFGLLAIFIIKKKKKKSN